MQARRKSTTPRLAHVNPQPRLPIPEASWDPMTFARRCALVRVPGDPGDKWFYLALAMQGQPLAKADVATFRIRLENLLFLLQCSKGTFYKRRRRLEAHGLLDIKRTAKSTYVRVFARRALAEPMPFAADDGYRQSKLGFTTRVVNQISHTGGKSIDGDQRRDEELADMGSCDNGARIGDRASERCDHRAATWDSEIGAPFCPSCDSRVSV